jgi:transcriptional regulator with XRE-family HTH domain
MKAATKDTLLAIIGKKIREARVASGWSQEDFAAYVQISRAYYGRIENGKFNFTMTKLMQIAKHLEMEPAEFCPSLDELNKLLVDKSDEVVYRTTLKKRKALKNKKAK